MNRFFLSLLFVLMSVVSYPQTLKKDHPLVGMWQYATTIELEDGRRLIDRKEIYKIINSDNTYSVLINIVDLPEDNNIPDRFYTQVQSTVLSQKGTYEIESDSVYNEFVTNHYLNKALTVTTSKMRYRFSDNAKNILLIECYNESLQRWISELWTRVVPMQENVMILDERK